MSIVHIVGKLEFAGGARLEQGIFAFDARRYTEFTDLEDLQVRGSKEIAVDVEREVEVDCADHYHEAFVALAATARRGSLELRWRGEPWARVWAGGHYLAVDPPAKPGRMTSLPAGRLMRWYTEWPGRMAETRKDNVEFSAAAASPDGAFLVAAAGPPALPWKRTGGDLGQFKVRAHWGVAAFDLATGAERWRSFAASGLVGALAVAPDSATVLAASVDGNLYLLDAASGALVHAERKALIGGCAALAFSPDGGLVAAAGRVKKVGFRDYFSRDQVVKVWRLPDWKLVKTFTAQRSVTDLVFAKKGDQLTVWSGDAGGGPQAKVLTMSRAAAAGKPQKPPAPGWVVKGGALVAAKKKS